MEPPKLPSLFKIQKHRTFSYKPRYYNPEEEERKEKLKALRGNDENFSEDNTAQTGSRIKGSFKSTWRANYEKNKSAQKSSNIRIAAVIFVLALLAYLILKY